MYNTQIKLTYHDPSNNENTDKLYQEEFLKVFGLETYDDSEVSKRMHELYLRQGEYFGHILEYVSLTQVLPIKLTPKQCFPFLFSWEFFHITHDVLCTNNNSKGKKLQKLYEAFRKWEK